MSVFSSFLNCKSTSDGAGADSPLSGTVPRPSWSPVSDSLFDGFMPRGHRTGTEVLGSRHPDAGPGLHPHQSNLPHSPSKASHFSILSMVVGCFDRQE